jgi:ribonuclease Z
MTEVFFLGTGGSLPSKTRDNTAFLVKPGRRAFLVDCPGSVIQKILKTGTDPLDVEAVFITHVHPDHVYGLPSLVHSLMLRDHSFRLCGSAETLELCRDLLDLFHLRKPKFKTRVEFVALEPGTASGILDGAEVSALRLPHHPSSLAYQFRLGSGPQKIVFSGDTPVHPELFRWAGGADALFHECSAPSRLFAEYPALSAMHTSSSDLGMWSERSGIRRLFPCHFLEDLGYEPSEIEDEIKTVYSGHLHVPSDFDRIELG